MKQSVGELYADVTADITGLRKGLQKAQTEVKVFSAKIKNNLQRNAAQYKRMGRDIAIVGAAITAGLGAMIKSFGSFDASMRKATAVSDITEKQFLLMSKMVQSQSVKLNKKVEELADGFYYLGSAGLSATEQLKAFDSIALLSKAAIITMGEATEMTVDTMKGFKIGFEDTNKVIDIFTNVVTSSNQKFGQLGEAMSVVSGVARSMNNNLAQTSALIGIMADVGIKGAKSGMMLRRSLLNLAAPTSEMRNQLKKLNVSIYDSTTGKMKPFIQIIGEISDALKGASEEETNFTFKTLFGARAIAGQIAIFDKGKDEIEKYVASLEEAGSTQEVADKQLAGFNEQLGILGKNIRLIVIQFGQQLAPLVESFAGKVGGLVEKIKCFDL